MKICDGAALFDINYIIVYDMDSCRISAELDLKGEASFGCDKCCTERI